MTPVCQGPNNTCVLVYSGLKRYLSPVIFSSYSNTEGIFACKKAA